MNNLDEIFIKEMSPIDAYNYGRQMMGKELNAMGDCEYAKGRVDAIEECIEMIEHDCFLSGTASKVLIHHLEQLKEQR